MYKPLLNTIETQKAIREIKTIIQEDLKNKLNLLRVSAPLFVTASSGLNDYLNGVERPISFETSQGDEYLEIVHSLAKWKRFAIKKYGIPIGEGIYTDMNAIRRDEDLDETHSYYVDQWDWEKVISRESRSLNFIKDTVNTIYTMLKSIEEHLYKLYPFLGKFLPKDITFITTQELEDLYPSLSPKEREDAISEKYKAVFLIGVGDILNSGIPHDGRASDYDDWKLNGDILLWNPVLKKSFEISSMGIRVDSSALEYQLKERKEEFKKKYEYHKAVLEDKLPLTIGGGIGQSRICMYFLRKAHIGEVQVSVWPKNMIKDLADKNIHIL